MLQLRQDGRYVVYQIRSREGGEKSHRIALGSLVRLKDSLGEQVEFNGEEFQIIAVE